MKQGIYIAVALTLGALAANFLLADPGYVAIRIAGRLFEMSAVTLVLLAFALYFAVRLALRVATARTTWRRHQEDKRHARARKGLARGILEMAEGDWARSEDTLLQSAREAESPVAHLLVAARAAELQGATQRRDEILTRALEASAERRAPVLVMQAEMLLKHKQTQAAITTLEQLEASGERNPRGLLLLARALRQTGDWEKLQDIEPRLRSTRGVPTAVADEAVAQIYLDRLKAAGNARDPKLIASAWKEMPKSLVQRPEIVVAYVRAAMNANQYAEAESELRDWLERDWDEAVVLAYGDIVSNEPLTILDRAERWLSKRPQDPALLLTCARLAIAAELYGKARSYLETSIAIRPRLEAYQLLAVLMDQLGERERAFEALNDALAHALGRRPDPLKIRARRFLERRQRERRRE